MKPQLTLKAFADWCEKQPKRKYYDYGDPKECACGQYAQHLGIEWIKEGDFWTSADLAACFSEPRTFRRLARSLRKEAAWQANWLRSASL